MQKKLLQHIAYFMYARDLAMEGTELQHLSKSNQDTKQKLHARDFADVKFSTR